VAGSSEIREKIRIELSVGTMATRELSLIFNKGGQFFLRFHYVGNGNLTYAKTYRTCKKDGTTGIKGFLKLLIN